MENYKLSGVVLIIVGALCVYWGIKKDEKKSMGGLKFKLLLGGTSLIVGGLVWFFT